MDAVRRNQYILLYILLKVQSGVSTNERNTALICAVNSEYSKCVATLLEAGADPNTRDSRGNTLLSSACQTGANDIVQMLLDAGALVRRL